MRRFYISTLFLALTLCAFTISQAQVRKATPTVDTGVVDLLTVPLEIRRPQVELSGEGFHHPRDLTPEFPGGTHAMYEFIKANLRIPSKARKARVSGRVFTSFTIEETGEIKDVKVLKGLGFGCDEEAIRVVQLMPKWKPGQQGDKIVSVRYSLPILFTTK